MQTPTATDDFRVTLLATSVEGSGYEECYGFNILSSVVRSLGLPTRTIFVPFPFYETLPDCLLEQLTDLCQGSSLIGLSVLTNYFHNSGRIATRLKDRLGVPIIWGGKHPTLSAEECFEFADMVCLEEGEDTICEVIDRLRNGAGMSGVSGLWYRDGDEIVRNELRPLNLDLDGVPVPDMGLDEHFVRDGDVIRPARLDDLKPVFKGYPTMIARGCPLKCTFCTNSTMRLRKVRVRSVDSVLSEIEGFIGPYPQTQSVFFRDDTLFALPQGYTEEFTAAYRDRIGLPISSSGIIPTSVSERKVQLFVDAGLRYVKMGVQSGSQRVRQQIYERPESDKQVMEAARILNSHVDVLRDVRYLLITDNPWETEEDQVQSLRFISTFPRPCRFNVFSLMLFPGTKLYLRAKEEGLFTDPQELYRKKMMTLNDTYFNRILMLMRHVDIGPRLMKLLTWKRLYKSPGYQRLFHAFFMAFYGTTVLDRRRLSPPRFGQSLLGTAYVIGLRLRTGTFWKRLRVRLATLLGGTSGKQGASAGARSSIA